MKWNRKDLTCLVALVMASGVFSSPAEAGGIRQWEPFVTPTVMRASTPALQSLTGFSSQPQTPSICTQPVATPRVPGLLSASGLGVKVGARF